jgi:hypothetical protein
MEWKTPPRPVRYKRSNTEWQGIADTLKKNPNEWALVAQNVNPSTVTHIRKGRLKAFEPEGQYEASGHGRNENGYTKELYARFVGVGVASPASTPSITPVEFFSDPEL